MQPLTRMLTRTRAGRRLATGCLMASLAAAGAVAPAARAQTFAVEDSVLRRLWTEGMAHSQVARLAQVLDDSIGPRLTGSPGYSAAAAWLQTQYRAWDVPARTERYGTWRGWRRGATHVDLLAPRFRTLEATMLAWSPGTRGPVTGRVVALPALADSAALDAWLPRARGAFVLASLAQASCRPDESWAGSGTPAQLAEIRRERTAADSAWTARVRHAAGSPEALAHRLDRAGAAGVLTSRWARGWGVDRVFDATTVRAPTLDVGCEDYGLLARLAEHGQGPVLRVEAQAQSLGTVPAFNVIAELRGMERPDEYVVLSAHLDSWDGASGATDNGTGTVLMLEAMRLLRAAYPRPRRTILVGHWDGEEQGLNGSRAFAADHPEVVAGLQALFNQDNGTGRVAHVPMGGLLGAGAAFARWLDRVPAEISDHVALHLPSWPAGDGSDFAPFTCAGAPAFNLNADPWDYGRYTWHTTRDTFDKVVLENVRENATFVAMLAYLASEDPTRVPRTRRTLPADSATGQPTPWPACVAPVRNAPGLPR